MNLLQLLNEYSNQFPDEPSLLPLIYQYGEEQAAVIIKERKGQKIVINRDRNSPDYMEFSYV